jgi:hypothetical protein
MQVRAIATALDCKCKHDNAEKKFKNSSNRGRISIKTQINAVLSKDYVLSRN